MESYSSIRTTLVDIATSAVIAALLFGSFSAVPAFAALSCSITTAAACISPAVIVYRMSASSNAHAELPSQSTAAYASNVACCTGVASLGNSCSGNFNTVLKLSAVTNAHVTQNIGSFTQPACLSVPSGSVSVGYGASCGAFDTTVGSMSAATNAHVGNAAAYPSTLICASAVANSLTFLTDSGSEALPALTPGTTVATTSILTVTTGNSTGFNITALRSNASATLLLNSDNTVTFPDKTVWSAPAATTTAGNGTASTTQPQTLQFRILKTGTDTADYASVWWGTDDSTANALFAGFPTTAQSILNRSTAAAATTTAYALYNINALATQKTGAYSGTITYSATANP